MVVGAVLIVEQRVVRQLSSGPRWEDQLDCEMEERGNINIRVKGIDLKAKILLKSVYVTHLLSRSGCKAYREISKPSSGPV